MARVKILYHDNCFDGATSASLFARFYQTKIDDQAEFEFAGKTHSTGEVYGPSAFDGDVNVVVDFRYSAQDRLDWWFDHHVSAFQSSTDEAHFRQTVREKHFYDPAARSCAKFLAETCAKKFNWDNSAYADLIYWADIIDGAQFESPQAAVELAEPALKLMTWVENNHDPALKLRFIHDLTHMTLADLAAQNYIQDALRPIFTRNTKAIDIVRARASIKDHVVFFDVGDDGLDGTNKFIPYYLYPECYYVVSVSTSPTRSKVSVGSNPWKPETRTRNIAEICERYGGGGHPVVGAISLKTSELPRARQIAEEIVSELRQSSRPG